MVAINIQMQNYVGRMENHDKNSVLTSYSFQSILSYSQRNEKTNYKDKGWLMKFAKTIIIVIILAFCIPISISYALGIPIQKTLTLIVAVFALEYFAAAIGISLGLNPAFTILVMTCVALSVIILLMAVFDIVGEKSKKVSNFLSKAREKAKKTKVLQKYGAYGLVLAVPLLGFYVCPAIAWVMGWRRDHAISMIVTGFILASSIVLLAGMGLFKFFLTK